MGGLEVVATTIAAWVWPEEMPLGLAIPLVLIGIGVMAYAVWGMKPQAAYYGEWLPKRWLWNWRVQFNAEDGRPISHLIPLSQAAQKAYEKTEGTNAARQAEKEPDGDVRSWYVIALTDHGKTPLYGVRLPSNRVRRIDPDDLKSADFIHGGQTMKVRGTNEIMWDRVYIKKSDLNRMIKEIRKW